MRKGTLSLEGTVIIYFYCYFFYQSYISIKSVGYDF
jgi:hypothetical protein